jgi:hypothetical protein
MTFTNPLLQQAVDELSAQSGSIHVATEAEEEEIHAILEATGMKLGENLELTYSRRPDLRASFREAFTHTAVFTDRAPVTFVSALSEVDVYWEGQRRGCYYASDLRFTRKATAQSRRTFAEYYRRLVQALPDDSVCYTAILDENATALRRLKGRSFPLAYNEAFPYQSRTWVTLPSVLLNARVRAGDLEMRRPVSEDGPSLSAFISEQVGRSAFSHDVQASRGRSHDELVVTLRGRIVGYCSTYRPASRGLRVHAKSLGMKALSKAAMWLTSSRSRSGKLPWVYISSLVLDEEVRAEPNLLPALFQALVREGAVRMGDLVLLVHPRSDEPCFAARQEDSALLKCPQIVKSSKIYIVDPEVRERRMKGNVHLDPTLL